MTKILEFLKKLVFETIIRDLVKSAFYGVLLGGAVALVAYAACDILGEPLIPWLQANTDFYLTIKLWFAGWGIAGVIAKIIPW